MIFFDLVRNPVVISAGELLILSAIRINVVFALILASLVGCAAAGLGFPETMKAFLGAGLANGAKLAFNYVMLGAFFRCYFLFLDTELLTQGALQTHRQRGHSEKILAFKYTLLLILSSAAISLTLPVAGPIAASAPPERLPRRI